MKLLNISIFLIMATTYGTIVHTPKHLSGYYPTPRIHRFGLGQIGWAPLNATVVPYLVLNLTGLIAFIPAEHDFPGGFGLESMSIDAMNRGAIGIMAMGQVPTAQPGGLEFMWNTYSEAALVKIPVVEMGLLNSLPFLAVFEEGENFTVTLTDDDPNPWYDYVDSVGYKFYFPLVWGYISLLVVFLTIHRSYYFLKYRGLILNTTSLFLALEFLSNLERLLCFSTDPMYARMILPHLAVSIMFTFTFPFTLITTLLIGFSWMELLKSIKSFAHTSPTFMKYTRIPFGIISLILVFFELSISTLRGLFFNIGTILTVNWAIYASFGLLISSFFWVTGIRILLILDKDSSVMSKEFIQGVRTTKYLLFSGFMVTGWSIIVAICITPIYLENPIIWTTLNNLLLFFTFGTSISQILALPLSKSKTSYASITVGTSTPMIKSLKFGDDRENELLRKFSEKSLV